MSVEDVGASTRGVPGNYDMGRVRALGYSGRFILLKGAMWAYIGTRSDYLLVEGLYCSCGSFIRSLTRKPSCIHLTALEEAKRSGRYRSIKVSEEEAVAIAWELLTSGFSRRLREKLYETVGSRGSRGVPEGSNLLDKRGFKLY